MTDSNKTETVVASELRPTIFQEDRKASAQFNDEKTKTKVTVGSFPIMLPSPSVVDEAYSGELSKLSSARGLKLSSPKATVLYAALSTLLLDLQREGSTKGTHAGKNPIVFESEASASEAIEFQPRHPDLPSASTWLELESAVLAKGDGRISDSAKVAALNSAMDSVFDSSKPIESATRKVITIALGNVSGTPTAAGWASFIKLPTTAFSGDKLQRLVDYLAGEAIPALVSTLNEDDKAGQRVADELEQGLALAVSDAGPADELGDMEF